MASYAPPFVQILYEVVSDVMLKDVIGWSDGKNGLIIHDKAEFVRLVLPRLCNSSSFDSFGRQMNGYGFSKVAGPTLEFVHTGDMFRKGRPELLQYIRRKPSQRGPQPPSPPRVQGGTERSRALALAQQQRKAQMDALSPPPPQVAAAPHRVVKRPHHATTSAAPRTFVKREVAPLAAANRPAPSLPPAAAQMYATDPYDPHPEDRKAASNLERLVGVLSQCLQQGLAVLGIAYDEASEATPANTHIREAIDTYIATSLKPVMSLLGPVLGPLDDPALSALNIQHAAIDGLLPLPTPPPPPMSLSQTPSESGGDSLMPSLTVLMGSCGGGGGESKGPASVAEGQGGTGSGEPFGSGAGEPSGPSLLMTPPDLSASEALNASQSSLTTMALLRSATTHLQRINTDELWREAALCLEVVDADGFPSSNGVATPTVTTGASGVNVARSDTSGLESLAVVATAHDAVPTAATALKRRRK